MTNGSKQADWSLQWQNRRHQIFYGVVSRIWPSFQLNSVSKNGLEQTIALKTDGLHPSSSCRILFSEKNSAFLQPPAMAQTNANADFFGLKNLKSTIKGMHAASVHSKGQANSLFKSSWNLGKEIAGATASVTSASRRNAGSCSIKSEVLTLSFVLCRMVLLKTTK